MTQLHLQTRIIDLLKARLGNVLTVQGLKTAAKAAAQIGDLLLPGKDGTEKAASAERWLLLAVEEYDDKIPVLGRFMDLPIVDALEAAAVRSAIAWGYAALRLEGDQVTDPIDLDVLMQSGPVGVPATEDDFGPSMAAEPPGRR